ncbi:MAG: tRNA 2-thiouridine(34) synthase MnmA [Pseudobutyrivibrio sp.]|nr:tRNA 2-thiouridine(34) synthase MnmA [Pseudobutyrivibrio sp.]
MTKKALIAMSGGVDSSVSAFLMKKQGYECMGANMRLYSNEDIGEDSTNTCCSLDDVSDARAVANLLDMPFYVFNFQEEFKEYVIDNFISSYQHGVTPNPCIECNRHLKFARFYKRARELGCDLVVTGHYARIEQDENTGRWLLKKAIDPSKDQSYVLYSMNQDQLEHTRFPLGAMTKDEARAIAAENGFINAKKHDSQDICFVPDGDYASFIIRHTGKTFPEGDFVDEQGNVLGRHKGIIHYTIGQRKGLGISSDRPYFVCNIDVERNQVVLTHDPNRSSTTLYADQLNLISIEKIEEPIRVKAKIRYHHNEQWATVSMDGKDRIKVVFDEPQRAITKGQAIVMYDGDLVVGGARIVECH